MVLGKSSSPVGPSHMSQCLPSVKYLPSQLIPGADLAVVIGASDTVNSDAEEDPETGELLQLNARSWEPPEERASSDASAAAGLPAPSSLQPWPNRLPRKAYQRLSRRAPAARPP